MKKLVSTVISMLLFLSSVFVYASEPTFSTSASLEKVQTFSAQTLPESIYKFIEDCDVEIKDDSVIWIEQDSNSSALRIQNTEGTKKTLTSVFEISTDEDGNSFKNNSVAELLNPPIQPLDGYTQPFNQEGIKVSYTCVYNLEISDRWYYHMIGSYFTYKADAGTAPSSIRLWFSGYGDLYQKSSSSYKLLKEDQHKVIDFTRYDPSKNTIYSKPDEMPTNQYIVPINANGGMEVILYVNVGGRQLYDHYIFS